MVAFNHAHTRSLTCNRGAISWKAHWWPISCTIADSVLHQYFSCNSLHVGFAHIAVYCRAPVCIGISHAPDCMLALRISQFIAVHPFASIFLMHQIACWFCARSQVLLRPFAKKIINNKIIIIIIKKKNCIEDVKVIYTTFHIFSSIQL